MAAVSKKETVKSDGLSKRQSMFPTSISGGEIATIAAGFFFIMWIVSLRGRKPKERRWYSTDIPSTLHIEHEA